MSGELLYSTYTFLKSVAGQPEKTANEPKSLVARHRASSCKKTHDIRDTCLLRVRICNVHCITIFTIYQGVSILQFTMPLEFRDPQV